MAKMDTQEASRWLNKVYTLYEDVIARAAREDRAGDTGGAAMKAR
jgi:hypothetical protein